MDFNQSSGYSDVVITNIPCPNCSGLIASREHEDTGWTQYECESCGKRDERFRWQPSFSF